MDLTVFTETRYAVDGNGKVRTSTGEPASASWTRYVEVFDRVTVVARVARSRDQRFDAAGPVSFLAAPYYVGPAQYLRRLMAIRGVIRAACAADSAFILRVPGRLGALAGQELQRIGKPYGIEVLGDPADVFARGAVHHPLRPFFQRAFAADLKRLAQHASAAAYVTETTLQQRYPCPGCEVGVSDIEIGPDALASTWKRVQPGQHTFRIVTVGSLAQLYKGPDVLLAALAQCHARGLDVSAVFVGDGRYRAPLEVQAVALGLGGRIRFRGEVPAGVAVRAELDAADLFVLPSRADGLPRALIEAMARGLPCLASRVGGIVELLDAEDLLPPGDSGALAQKIEDVLRQPAGLERMAARNLARAREFSQPLLLERRHRFYQEVVRRTLVSHVPQHA
jgi:glycosyltransferase involved in cell wall biosynthesis